MFRKSRILITLLTIVALLSACTSQEFQTIEAIVTLAEGVLPLIPNLSPADAQLVTSYTNSALTITDDVLANPNQAGAAQAAADFNKLVLPQLTAAASPQTQQALQKLADSVQKFIATYKTTSVSTIDVVGARALAEPQKTKPFQIPPKQQPKIAKLRARIQAAKERLRNRK